MKPPASCANAGRPAPAVGLWNSERLVCYMIVCLAGGPWDEPGGGREGIGGSMMKLKLALKLVLGVIVGVPVVGFYGIVIYDTLAIELPFAMTPGCLSPARRGDARIPEMEAMKRASKVAGAILGVFVLGVVLLVTNRIAHNYAFARRLACLPVTTCLYPMPNRRGYTTRRVRRSGWSD
jgi:hypothetical protein